MHTNSAAAPNNPRRNQTQPDVRARRSVEPRGASEIHSAVLPNLGVTLDQGLSRFEPGISPWKFPQKWNIANDIHVTSIMHNFKIMTGNDEIEKAKTKITYPVSLDVKAGLLTKEMLTPSHPAIDRIHICSFDRLRPPRQKVILLLSIDYADPNSESPVILKTRFEIGKLGMISWPFKTTRRRRATFAKCSSIIFSV